MFARFVKPTSFIPRGPYSPTRIAGRVRTLATVEGSAGRTMPLTPARATPVSHDRATFTIRVRLKSTIDDVEEIANGMAIGWSRDARQVLRCKV